MNAQTQLISFIKKATSPFQVVQESASILNDAGFMSLDFDKTWNLQKGGCYYTKVHDSSLFAFRVSGQLDADHTFRIASAHTDHPCLHIKPHAEIPEKDYLRINVEIYGGMTKNTWLDRPLSIAGKVALKSSDIFHPHSVLVDFQRPLLTIPNLAIHMNRDLNKGVELNNQTEMLPIIGMLCETLDKDQYFLNLLAKELKVAADDILDFDLFIYNYDECLLLGMEHDFISGPRLDNLTSVFALVNGIASAGNQNTINITALYDNEEIGSRSKQGADSFISNILLEKIYQGLSLSSAELYNTVLRSHMVSIDVAHGLHPNYTGKNDPTNQTMLNKGICIKINSSQKYATDCEAIAMIEQLCMKYDIPYQKYVNRSDIAGGGTLGSLSSSWLPMKTVDLGIPLLAMHSARELMGAKDQDFLNRLVMAFFMA